MTEVYKFYIKGHEVLIDRDKVEKILPYTWYIQDRIKAKTRYIATSMVVNGVRKYVLLHRFLLNPDKTKVIDHINHNTLDNRLCNLRICTYSENNRNTTSRTNTSSKYLGVHLNKKSNMFSAKLRYNGTRLWLGSFKTEIEAAKAYNEAAIKYHGEFANLNKI